jgi:hypothetical protein
MPVNLASKLRKMRVCNCEVLQLDSLPNFRLVRTFDLVPIQGARFWGVGSQG